LGHTYDSSYRIVSKLQNALSKGKCHENNVSVGKQYNFNRTMLAERGIATCTYMYVVGLSVRRNVAGL